MTGLHHCLAGGEEPGTWRLISVTDDAISSEAEATA
jgi:hypothetical protein